MPAWPLRVALLNWRDTGHPEGGGSERYVERVAAGLAADGCDVRIHTARYPGARRREVRDGVAFARAGSRLTVYPRTLAALLADRLRGNAPDVVVDVQNGVPFMARLVAGRPVVVLVHHVHREQWPVAVGGLTARLGWWIESRLSPRVHRGCQYLTVSEVTRRELVELGVRGPDVAVAHNGLDLPVRPAEAPPARDPYPRLVVLGRLVPHKRVEDALHVLAELLPDLPDTRLSVIGDGWWAPRLVEEAERLGVSAAVDFHGFVAEEAKHDLLARSWILLAPSVKEGWGLMVVEAAAHGVPAVAYRTAGGLSESILDGVTGVLVDDLDGLTAATRAMIEDGDLRGSLGEAGRRHVARFSWRRTTTAVLRVLRRAADGLPPVDDADLPAPSVDLRLPADRASSPAPTPR